VRSATRDRLDQLKTRVLGCLSAGAAAAGCAMHHEWLDPAYDEMVDNLPLLDRYVANARVVGREPLEPTPDTAVSGSTDMGNVSHAVPSIHPMVQAAPPGVAIHTAEFATHTGSAMCDRAVIDGAKMLALTVVDLWLDGPARQAMAAAHAARAEA
jgi:metal-dependent amidase/aminoacylase/carboxypeptidase family protein